MWWRCLPEETPCGGGGRQEWCQSGGGGGGQVQSGMHQCVLLPRPSWLWSAQLSLQVGINLCRTIAQNGVHDLPTHTCPTSHPPSRRLVVHLNGCPEESKKFSLSAFSLYLSPSEEDEGKKRDVLWRPSLLRRLHDVSRDSWYKNASQHFGLNIGFVMHFETIWPKEFWHDTTMVTEEFRSKRKEHFKA